MNCQFIDLPPQVKMSQIKSSTMPIHHIKGQPGLSTYVQKKWCLTCDTNRETLCSLLLYHNPVVGPRGGMAEREWVRTILGKTNLLIKVGVEHLTTSHTWVLWLEYFYRPKWNICVPLSFTIAYAPLYAPLFCVCTHVWECVCVCVENRVFVQLIVRFTPFYQQHTCWNFFLIFLPCKSVPFCMQRV